MFEPYPTLKRVIVNSKDAETPPIRGMLWRKRRGYLVLRKAELLRAGGQATGMDGEVVIPVNNVAFIQVVD